MYFCFLLEFLAGESLERDFIVPRTTSSLQPRQHASPAVAGNDILMHTVYVKKCSKCSWVSVASTDPRAYIGAVADYKQHIEGFHGDVKETDSSSRGSSLGQKRSGHNSLKEKTSCTHFTRDVEIQSKPKQTQFYLICISFHLGLSNFACA